MLRCSFGDANIIHYPPGTGLGLRLLPDWELVWIQDGQVRWTSDGIEHAAPPGTIILARPGTRERYRWDPDRHTRHAYLHFTITEGLDELPPRALWPLVAIMPEHDIVRPLFRQVLTLLRARPSAWQELAQGAWAQLMRSWCHRCWATVDDPAQAMPEPLERLVKLLTARWADGAPAGPGLVEMAQAARVSPGHLCRLTRRHFGHPPEAALRLLRLDRAARLLIGTDLSIAEVAALAGDLDAFHFSRVFHARHGCSPRSFRQSGRGPESLPPPLAVLAARIWG